MIQKYRSRRRLLESGHWHLEGSCSGNHLYLEASPAGPYLRLQFHPGGACLRYRRVLELSNALPLRGRTGSGVLYVAHLHRALALVDCRQEPEGPEVVLMFLKLRMPLLLYDQDILASCETLPRVPGQLWQVLIGSPVQHWERSHLGRLRWYQDEPCGLHACSLYRRLVTRLLSKTDWRSWLGRVPWESQIVVAPWPEGHGWRLPVATESGQVALPLCRRATLQQRGLKDSKVVLPLRPDTHHLGDPWLRLLGTLQGCSCYALPGPVPVDPAQGEPAPSRVLELSLDPAQPQE